MYDAYEQNIKSKLTNAGYTSPRELAFPTVLDIAKNLQINSEDAEIYSAWALRKLEDSNIGYRNFSSANDIYLDKRQQKKLSTGCKALNDMLSGGIEKGSIYQFYGSSGTGKTQLCFNLCIMAQQPIIDGGFDGRIIYLDTENKFSPERILEIAKARAVDLSDILEKILVVRTINSIHMKESLDKISHIAEKDSKLTLVIVDSIINHFRQEFPGRENLSERQNKLEKCMRSLLKISELYNITIIMTNQVTSLADSDYKDSYVSAGGNILAHATKHRIHLQNIGENFHARVVSSVSLPRTYARFTINESGLCDITESEKHRNFYPKF